MKSHNSKNNMRLYIINIWGKKQSILNRSQQTTPLFSFFLNVFFIQSYINWPAVKSYLHSKFQQVLCNFPGKLHSHSYLQLFPDRLSQCDGAQVGATCERSTPEFRTPPIWQLKDRGGNSVIPWWNLVNDSVVLVSDWKTLCLPAKRAIFGCICAHFLLHSLYLTLWSSSNFWKLRI